MDWTVTIEPGRSQNDVADGFLTAWAAAEGKPYIAKITGRDATFGWRREFLRLERSYPSTMVNSEKIVRLSVRVLSLCPLPVALEVRWGPNTGVGWYDNKTQKSGRLCAHRGLFVIDSSGLRQVEERHVAWLLDERIVVPGPPRRPPDMRAKTIFDEEV